MSTVEIWQVPLGAAPRAESYAALRRLIRGVNVTRGRRPTAPGVEVSLSHTEGLALIAAAGQRVGVDVEHLSAMPAVDELDDLVTLVLSRGERVELQAAKQRERPRRWLQIWTRKEALLKASGAQCVAISEIDTSIADGVTLVDLDVGPNHVAAMAVVDD